MMLSSWTPPSTEPSSPRTCCELCALRCQVGFKCNPPTYRADSPYPIRELRFADRDIISTVRTRVTALPIIISLLRAIRIIHPWLPYLHSRLDKTQSPPARPCRRYQLLRITTSTRDLMRSILPSVKPNILHTGTSLSRETGVYI